MKRPVLISCKPTANALRIELRRIEAAGVELKSLVAIENKDNKSAGTIAEVENSGGALPKIVAVVFDPPGIAPQPGDTLACKGSACIGASEQNVAVYRRE